jgi:hypothetical protein
MADHGPALRWQPFRLPRRGHTADEYEDAFAGDDQAGRFAVADGASESSFAAAWARLLVEEYVRTPGLWSTWLPTVRQRWADGLSGRALPWYAEAKAEEGAYATLLGVRLDLRRRRWFAQAIGDSCLFHVRGDRLLRAFPVARSEEFGNQPALIGSRPPRAESRRPTRYLVSGPWKPEDRLLLMTDALAQWFLQQAEAGGRPWEALEGLATDDDFARWAEGLRDRKELRNDDLTLLTIRARPTT